MNKSESKYFSTAKKMDQAFLELLEKKDFEYITIKEICQKADVNRSTFYLHYEDIGDLLEECIEYANNQFLEYFENKYIDLVKQNKEELILIQPQYLIPYLTYIKDHKRLHKTFLSRRMTLNTQRTYEKMFEHIFDPIMEKFQIPKNEREYLATYYIHGLIAIVNHWVNNDCQDSIEQISQIMTKCVFSNRG